MGDYRAASDCSQGEQTVATVHQINKTNKYKQVLKDAMLYFLHSTPNLATVIPAMDHIDQVLLTHLCNKKFLPSIRSGVSLGQETLNCYYSRTDQSEVYRIAMSK